jgi:hypothetical protein
VPSSSLSPALLIDDLDESAARLSPLGRDLMKDDIVGLRRILVEHARLSGWQVLFYSSFVDWSTRLSGDAVVLLADKLYPKDRLHGQVIEVDVHRDWLDTVAEREVSLQTSPFLELPTGRITVIDDAAYSGETLRNLCRHANGAGGTVDHVIIAARSARAENVFRSENVKVSALATVPADWDILHARDFSPWLPLSGRRLGARSKTIECDFALRLAPLFYNRGAWLQLSETETCYGRLTDLAIGLIDRLEMYLGRSAMTQDVKLLGREVSLPMASPDTVGSIDLVNTRLREIVGKTNPVET